MVVFTHEGKLVIVDQPSFTQKGRLETNESTVPLVDQVSPVNESLGVGIYSSLMGTFDIPTPINYLGSTCIGNSIETVVYRTDPWVLLFRYEPEVHLSKVELAY